MSQAPLHVQVLVHLRNQVRARKRDLEERVGKGMKDLDYQRHVGRIAEDAQVLEMIQTLMQSGIEAVEDLDLDHEQARSTVRRPARRVHRTQ